VIGRLHHVAIAVADLEAASAFYHLTLGAKVSGPLAMPDHGVSVAFVELPNTKIELIEPLGERSPIAGFLAKHPGGGLHHICFEVEDILTACEQLMSVGTHVLGDGTPKIGSHGKEVLFLNPKDCGGTLIELQRR
jgi:methylmalonyl-CoA/ethylmalonyl-CoA epimerase